MSTVITVYASVMHLAIAPKNPLGNAVYTAIVSDEKITENIIKSIVTGVSSKMKRVYIYAKDNYELKLPSGATTQSNILSDVELASLIKLNIGSLYSIVILKSGYEEYSLKIRVIQFLCLDRNYSSVDNIVLNYPGFTDTNLHKVTLNSIIEDVDGLHATINYDVYNKVITEIIDEESGSITETTEDWVLDTVPHSESVLLENVFVLPEGTPCFYTVYQKFDSLGDLLPDKHTWFNDLTSGLYPELTEPTVKFKGDDFLPVVPIRYNNVDLTDISLADTPLYKTSKQLLKIANIPFEYLGVQINENPSIDEIDHAYVMFGVDLQTEQSESLQYLNLFFDRVHDLNAYSNYKILSSDGIDFLEYGLNLKLSYDGVTSDIIEGMLDVAKVGTTTKTITLGLDDVLTLDTKISKTLIRRVTVTNLVLYNYIYNKKAVVTSLRSIAKDKDNHNLVVPIQYSIANSMPMSKRNALYTDGTVMIINSVVVTHLKWYQKSWFKFVVIIVMVIVMVIISIASAGSMSAWWGALMASVMSGMIIVNIVISIIISLIVSYAAKWIVTKYGAQLGIIGAMVLTVIALVASQGRYGYDIMANYTLSYAQLALQGAMALISSANEFLISEGQKIISEYDAFNTLIGIKNDELKAKQDLLENAYDVDPLVYLKPARLRIIPNESPDAFIQRTLGLVENTMYILHEEIPNYCDSKLKLERNVTTDMYGMNFGV